MIVMVQSNSLRMKLKERKVNNVLLLTLALAGRVERRISNALCKSCYGHLKTMLSDYLLYKWNNLPFIGSI